MKFSIPMGASILVQGEQPFPLDFRLSTLDSRLLDLSHEPTR
jgi:hypothetical protein